MNNEEGTKAKIAHHLTHAQAYEMLGWVRDKGWDACKDIGKSGQAEKFAEEAESCLGFPVSQNNVRNKVYTEYAGKFEDLKRIKKVLSEAETLRKKAKAAAVMKRKEKKRKGVYVGAMSGKKLRACSSAVAACSAELRDVRYRLDRLELHLFASCVA